MPDTSAEALILIASLTAKQQAVLGLIAMNTDGGHHPHTLEALVKKGLIESYPEILGGRFPVTITRYRVPVHVHIAYCAWASQSLSTEKEEQRYAT